MDEVSLGGWLRRRRQALGLTQEELARQIGCATITLRKIESDERRPSVQMAERLAQVLAVPADERSAFLRFARGNWSETPTDHSNFSPWRTTSSSRSHLPAAVNPLIGRDEDLLLVRAYLRDPHIRLVTLVGPPGIGKASLGLESARGLAGDFPAGVFFVGLGALDDPALLANTIGRVVGHVRVQVVSSVEELAESIGDRPMLILLVNCEHLIESISVLAFALLSMCPHLKILGTSRESLRVPGEWVFVVQALEVPKEGAPLSLETASRYSAVTLFVERARAAHPGFVLNDENLPSVASICARLDGLPLAIGLIAARVRFMPPQTLLELLSGGFILSADGLRAPSARQRTLANAIGWSFDLLTPGEQRVFTCLAVFAGGFTLEAACSICAGSDDDKPLVDVVTSLVDKSLVQRTSGTRGEYRFSMLATIRQFALNLLRRSGNEAEIRDRHLAYFVGLAEREDLELQNPNQEKLIDRCEIEYNNFHAAIEWAVSNAQTQATLRLLCALALPWQAHGRQDELLCWVDRVRSWPELDAYGPLYLGLLERLGPP